ncbi:MAG: hypothetical protein HQK89_05490 [Nitrospirae bacterium]|nr:hypothetical protein [Nitrospirota bacterium]
MNIDEDVKNLLVAFEEKDQFADIFNLFLDLSEKQEFRILGEPKNDVKLKLTIAELMKKIIKGASINNYLAMYVDKYKLWHGGFFANRMLSTFFYFEELGKGMVAVAKGKDNMEFARFTLYKNVFTSNKDSKYTH